jgi:hypothetical protein
VARFPLCASAIFCNARMCVSARASLTWPDICRTGGRAGALIFDFFSCRSVGGGAVGGGSGTPLPQAAATNITEIPTKRNLRREPVKPEVEINTSTSSAACVTTSRVGTMPALSTSPPPAATSADPNQVLSLLT